MWRKFLYSFIFYVRVLFYSLPLRLNATSAVLWQLKILARRKRDDSTINFMTKDSRTQDIIFKW